MKSIKIIKSGKFYNAYGDDALILHNLFGYKVSDQGKVGFPLITLNKVTNILTDNKINYNVVEKNVTVDGKTFPKNNYEKILSISEKRFNNELELNSLLKQIETLDEPALKRLIGVIKDELK